MSKESLLKYISKLKINNFRSYKELEIKVSNSNIAFVGENGSGKTNLLEALSLFALGRGLRSSEKSKLFRIDPETLFREKSWGVHINLNYENKEIELSTGISSNQNDYESTRSYSVLGNNVKSSEILSYVNFNWLTPQMDSIISGPESGRRKFIDRLISNFDPSHIGRLKRLQKNIRERLMIIEKNKGDKKWLSIIEKKISEDGIAVVDTRMNFVSNLDEITSKFSNKNFSSVRMQMKGDLEALISEGSAIDAEEKFFEYLQKNRNTFKPSLGPNVSSLILWHGNTGMTSDYCSSGQQKAILVSIILGYSQFLNKLFGSPPILLLDEINAHLDVRSFDAFYEYSSSYKGQIWMTGTDINIFNHINKKNDLEIFKIINSNITK